MGRFPSLVLRRKVATSFYCKFHRSAAAATTATFDFLLELDLVAADGAGVVDNNRFTTTSHLLPLERDRVAADLSFFDRGCATPGTFVGAGQLAATFIF